MFNWNKSIDPRDAVITAQACQISDLTSLLDRVTAAHAAEVKSLTDKLIAVTSPFAYREMTRQSDPVKVPVEVRPHRANFPGMRPDTRPAPKAHTPKSLA